MTLKEFADWLDQQRPSDVPEISPDYNYAESALEWAAKKAREFGDNATDAEVGTPLKRKPEIKCPYCGVDLMAPKPPPDGPSIGRRFTMAEIGKKVMIVRKIRAKAKRDASIQFEC